MARFGRVHEKRGGASARERRRDFARNVAGLSHAGHDDTAFAVEANLAGRDEGRPEARLECCNAPGLGGEGATAGGDQAISLAGRCGSFRRFIHEVASYRSMHPEKVAELIRAGLPDAEVWVRSDDQTHFEARVVSPAFEGRRSIARHQMIYRTLGELVGREIHALSIEALTPSEADAGPRI